MGLAGGFIEALKSTSQKLLQNPLKFYISMFRKDFLTGMAFLLVTNGLDVLTPLVLKQAIDLISAANLSEGNPTGLLALTVKYFAILTGLAMSRFGWRIYFNRYHTLSAEDLRNRMFKKLNELTPAYFNKAPVGELMSLCISDVQSFRGAIGSAVLILVDGLVLISFLLPLMIYLNWHWSIVTLIFFPAVPFLIHWVTKQIFTRYKHQQDQLAALSAFSAELVNGIRVIKSFVLEKLKLSDYNRLSRDYEIASNRTMQVDALFDPIMDLGMASAVVILVFVAGKDVIAGAASIGTVVAFQSYLRKLKWPMTAMGFGLSQYKKGMASFERIKELLYNNEITADQGHQVADEFSTLQAVNLSFKYEQSRPEILKNLNFKIERGQVLGVIGPVGSGKSTLALLITRLYQDWSGDLLLNGQDIRSFTLASVRKLITLVPQDPFLFSDSVANNLSPLAKPEHLADFANMADIQNEILELPSQYQTTLGERGVNLSGGQKQRLCLARGLANHAQNHGNHSGQLLILDDTLSAVDQLTEQRIIKNLAQLKNQGSTIIIVSHRLSVLSEVDVLMVLKEGSIEAIGTPVELATTSPTYKNLLKIQEDHSAKDKATASLQTEVVTS